MALYQVKEKFLSLVYNDDFIQRILIYSINHRVQEFSDPLTTTLLFFMNTPLQIVLCESGILPFKTSLLPVFPYSLLTKEEIIVLEDIVRETHADFQKETMESSGQYTLTICTGNMQSAVMCKKKILTNFIYVMFKYNTYGNDFRICKTLCNIIIQRLMSRILIPSEHISFIVDFIETCSTSDSTRGLSLGMKISKSNKALEDTSNCLLQLSKANEIAAASVLSKTCEDNEPKRKKKRTLKTNH